MANYDKIWEVLNSGRHVLLLIRDEGDPDLFTSYVEDIRAWFMPIVKSDYGQLDLLLVNGSWLSLRKFRGIPCPTDSKKDNIQVMLL